jgi:enoyl-[acyl-carrier protein] reductase II
MRDNRLCSLLGIEYPIIQAPMNWITGADLAAAVSNAGGLGTLGPNAGAKTLTKDVKETGERLRQQIRKVKTLTKKPFAVNFPIGAGDAEGEGGAFCQRCVEVALEEGISAAITSVGPPNVYTKAFKDAGVRVLHAVSTAGQARKAEQAGVDAVICEGYEGGGYKALTELSTMTLIPMTADAVKIVVVAAGGIADARGMAAALALGADGVCVGTRFIATHECDAHPKVKQALIEARDTATVSLKKWVVAGRVLKNSYAQKYLQMQESKASMEELVRFLSEHTLHQALVEGDIEEGELPCGQNAATIASIVSAAEVVRSLVQGMPLVIGQIKAKAPAD